MALHTHPPIASKSKGATKAAPQGRAGMARAATNKAKARTRSRARPRRSEVNPFTRVAHGR